MLKIGDTIRATGIGAMFVSGVPNSTGVGKVVHVAYRGEVLETSDFPECKAFQEMFPSQWSDGIFYMDEGADRALWLDPEDFEIIESGQNLN